MDKVLKAREQRIKLIKAKETSNLIICLKANIPGHIKQRKEAYILIRIFKKLLKLTFDVVNTEFYNSDDGPYYLLEIRENNVYEVKHKLVEIENTHPLGRLIDLDLYDRNKENISRTSLNIPSRKCMLCDNEVFACIRSKTHTKEEILSHIKENLYQFLRDELTKYLSESLNLELNLHPKFGLVTPYSNGSHDDMNYELMKEAQEVIIPGLIEMFFVGLEANNPDDAFQKGRLIGINSEFRMLSKTGGINAYRGLIFVLGLVMISFGYLLQRNLRYSDLYSTIIFMSKNLLNELKQEPTSNGMKIYHLYKIGGARKEAYLGLPNVRRAVDMLNQYPELNNEALTMTLIEIIKNCEDTVMIKRSGSLDKYNYYKNLVEQITEYNLEQIQKVTDEFIVNKISCGGSADILVTSIFIKLVFSNLVDI